MLLKIINMTQVSYSIKLAHSLSVTVDHLFLYEVKGDTEI